MKRNNREIAMIEVAKHYVKTNGTVRTVAHDLGISKTAVHCKLIRFVKKTDLSESEKELAVEVTALLQKNKQERAVRGGTAFRKKCREK